MKTTYIRICFFLLIIWFCSPVQLHANHFINSQKDTSRKTVFKIVDVMPEFPGGMDSMFKFIIKNVRYPEIAKKDTIEGTVIVEFIINDDGSISDVKRKENTKAVGGGCDEEAIRVVGIMPKWKPGKQSGKNVNVLMILPVKFKLH